jgi:hypothetical protein
LIVYGEQAEAFVSCLNDQEPIERIVVQKFERFYGRRMIHADRQRPDIVGGEPSGNIGRYRLR